MSRKPPPLTPLTPRERLLAPSGMSAFAPPDPDIADAVLLPLAEVFPNAQQARQAFDEDALAGLAASIAADGVLEPILVRRMAEGRYQIIAGERRRLAAALAGLDRIPALVRDIDDHKAAIWTAVENLQREDLDIEDEARWLQLLLTESGMSQRELAKRLGKDDAYIWRRVRLLRHPDLMAEYRAGQVSQNALDVLIRQREKDGAPAEPDPAPTVLPTRTERADLPHNEAPAPARWEWRPLQRVEATILRQPWTAVPRNEIGNARAWLQKLRAQLDAIEAQLPPPDVFDPTVRDPNPLRKQEEH